MAKEIVIGFKEDYFRGEEVETLIAPIVNGKVESCYFEHKYQAIIYAGLIESGVSKNDCSYISRYVCAMVEGIKK